MLNHYDDDDVKIAPDDLSTLFTSENTMADDNIDLFLHQRANGNTARARKLGVQYVEDLLDCVWTRPPEDVTSAHFDQQLKLLFAYAVHRVVEDHSPNQIIANAVLGSFYEHLEDADQYLYEKINNNAAFTLYMYLHRAGDENAESVGKTFSTLCNAGAYSDCVIIGESAYGRFFGACTQRILNAGFVE
ncbi:MAG: hypothetical protein ACK5L0_06165 [Candidatus Fimivivens sp.]